MTLDSNDKDYVLKAKGKNPIRIKGLLAIAIKEGHDYYKCLAKLH